MAGLGRHCFNFQPSTDALPAEASNGPLAYTDLCLSFRSCTKTPPRRARTPGVLAWQLSGPPIG